MKRIAGFLMAAMLTMALGTSAATVKYTCKPGDTLWGIMSKYKTTINDILRSNPQLKNPSTIKPGQTINVPTDTSATSLEAEVIRLVNVERSKRGLSALKENTELSRVARYKSADMVNKGYFAHTSPTYGTPFKMMESFGIRFTAAGENIAKGQNTAAEVMNGWMNSAGHRSNILSTSFSQIGVGVATDKNGVKYWTQMFIRPAG